MSKTPVGVFGMSLKSGAHLANFGNFWKKRTRKTALLSKAIEYS